MGIGVLNKSIRKIKISNLTNKLKNQSIKDYIINFYATQNGILYQNYVIGPMDEQIRTRDSQRSYTFESQDQSNWSESSHTYYYSKFQLFQDNEEINLFYRYSVFLQKLSQQLGDQWRDEASILYQPYFSSQDVFMNLLAVWLQAHPFVNTIHQNPLSKQTQPVFNSTFIQQFVARMKRIHAETQRKQLSDLKINLTCTKTVCMGFFLTANQIWQEMFRNEQKSSNKGFSLFQGVTKRIEQSFQPLMVVTQKISNLFGRKKVKLDESYYNTPDNEKMFSDCYMQFCRTMDLQKQLQRKMSQFNLEEQIDEECMDIKQKKKIVTKGQFKDQQAPLQKNIIENIYGYVTKFLKRKHSWQVASSFVTNILDINQQSMEEGTRIKVLKPAEDFYEKLIMGWLMIRTCKEDKQISFEDYLSHIKLSFGKSWRQKYIIPTKYFYERLIKHWRDIQKETLNIKLSEKQILNSLIFKIRQSMREDWQRKIKIEKKKKE